jgi:hypothetical protein
MASAIDSTDEKGQTALRLACEYGDMQAIGILLDAGADFHTGCSLGITPWEMACAKRLDVGKVPAGTSKGRCFPSPPTQERLVAVRRTVREASAASMPDPGPSSKRGRFKSHETHRPTARLGGFLLGDERLDFDDSKATEMIDPSALMTGTATTEDDAFDLVLHSAFVRACIQRRHPITADIVAHAAKNGWTRLLSLLRVVGTPPHRVTRPQCKTDMAFWLVTAKKLHELAGVNAGLRASRAPVAMVECSPLRQLVKLCHGTESVHSDGSWELAHSPCVSVFKNEHTKKHFQASATDAGMAGAHKRLRVLVNALRAPDGRFRSRWIALVVKACVAASRWLVNPGAESFLPTVCASTK